MQLRLDPASGSALQPGGAPVTQAIHVTNSMHGQKPIALRLRISYVHNGATKVEMCEVSGLPAGL
jgi:AP-1 complex subunit gamma-1